VPVAIKVSVDDRGVRKLMKRALRQTGDLSRPMAALGLWMTRDARRRLKARGSEDASGALGKSLTFTPAKDRVTIGSQLAYAAVQQLGHEGIRAKPPRQRLAIPLQSHLRRRHVWPSDLPEDELHFGGWSRAGNPLLRDSEEKPAYVLVEQVAIEPEPYLVFGVQAQAFLRGRLVRHIGLE